MNNHLKDFEFLLALDNLKLRTQYAKIVLLDYAEKPIKEIAGQISSGAISVNGSAAIRRTINLSMNANIFNNNIENLDNEISLNKKIKVFIGSRNPLRNYATYGDIVWFPCGLYLAATANITKGTNNWNIAITGKDKMVKLDGTVGGVFPASVTLNEKEEAVRKRAQNNYKVCADTKEGLEETGSDYNDAKLQADLIIKTLLQNDEFFFYYGITEEEFKAKNIKEQLTLAMEYYNHTAIENPTLYEIIYYVVRTFGEESPSNIIINDLEQTAKLLVKYRGDSPIYFNDSFTSFTFSPGKEGYNRKYVYGQDVGYKITPLTYPTNKDLIANAGETVVSVLDKIAKVLGNFEYFYDIDGRFVFQQKRNYLNTNGDLTAVTAENYFEIYSNDKYKYLISDFGTTSSISKSPKYENIKNDYIVWGKRKKESGAEIPICYHLAIDVKPPIQLASQYMWKTINEYGDAIYSFTDDSNSPSDKATLIGSPCEEWREEIYRQALLAQSYGTTYSVYDAELLFSDYDNPDATQWRKLYDPNNELWKEYNYWNPDVRNDPGKIDYWLDFIDEGSEIGKYSINAIGRRTKVISSDTVTSVFNTAVPDVIFLTPEEMNEELNNHYEKIGQKWFQLTEAYQELFVPSSTQASAYDTVRDLLYQHLVYNTQITLQCFPKYYLEPNNIMYIEDLETNTIGNYAISQFNLPLTYNGTMSITLTEVLNRI